MAKFFEIQIMTEDDEVLDVYDETLFLDDEFIDLNRVQEILTTEYQFVEDAYVVEVWQDGSIYGIATEDYIQYESWVKRQMAEIEHPQMV